MRTEPRATRAHRTSPTPPAPFKIDAQNTYMYSMTYERRQGLETMKIKNENLRPGTITRPTDYFSFSRASFWSCTKVCGPSLEGTQ